MIQQHPWSTAVSPSQIFFARHLPLSLIYVCLPPPHPLQMLLHMIKSYFISTLFNYILEYIYSIFIYNILLVLNVLFRYNTLTTYASKSILLTTDITFIVFLPDKTLASF